MAGPGFLNLFLSDAWFRHALASLREQGDRFGAGIVPPAERERMLVEFVSANPTGPLNAAGVAMPPTGIRWCGCWSSSATRSSGSTT